MIFSYYLNISISQYPNILPPQYPNEIMTFSALKDH